MPKNIHLITPFIRHELKETLIDAYRPMGIIWHPIMFRDEAIDFNNEPWIFPLIIPMDSKQDFGKMEIQNVKRNWFIQNCEIVNSDYYVAVDDDDMYEPNVFDGIKKMDDDIVIISMKRGYNIPENVISDRKYPTFTLIADPDNVQEGLISNQQSFVKGRIFRKYLYDGLDHRADGRLAVRRKEMGEQITYRPDLFALFNYYEPGRWERKKISFGVLINDAVRFDMVLRQSQIKGEMHYIDKPESATKGLNKLLTIMENEGSEVAILCHQDMFFRQGWITQVENQLAKLPDSWIIAGPIGKDMEGRICGRLHDTRIPQHFETSDIHEFPHPASCLDECVIIVNLKKKFRFDEALDGFDLYGTLCVLQTWEMGGTAWIIDAFCEHFCLRPFTWFPDELFEKNYKWLYERFKKMAQRKLIHSTVIGEVKDEPRFETSAI